MCALEVGAWGLGRVFVCVFEGVTHMGTTWGWVVPDWSPPQLLRAL